jgi:hypothetical protein
MEIPGYTKRVNSKMLSWIFLVEGSFQLEMLLPGLRNIKKVVNNEAVILYWFFNGCLTLAGVVCVLVCTQMGFNLSTGQNWLTVYAPFNSQVDDYAEEGWVYFGLVDFFLSGRYQSMTYTDCVAETYPSIESGCGAFAFCRTCSEVPGNTRDLFIVGGCLPLFAGLFLLLLVCIDNVLITLPMAFGLNAMQWVGTGCAIAAWINFQPCYKELIDWKGECNISSAWQTLACVPVSDDPYAAYSDDAWAGECGMGYGATLNGCAIAGFSMLIIISFSFSACLCYVFRETYKAVLLQRRAAQKQAVEQLELGQELMMKQEAAVPAPVADAVPFRTIGEIGSPIGNYPIEEATRVRSEI